MSYAGYLKDLLAPLRVYDLSGPFISGELSSQGMALDGVDAVLEELTRESSLATAESWGLEQIAGLLARRPVASDPRALGAALAALLRVSGDSFTPAAINDTLAGCGIPCMVRETKQYGTVEVLFPGTPGIPKGFEEMRKIIEDILPAHLQVEYVFWYLTWELLEQYLTSWKAIEDKALTWEQLEIYNL